MDPLTSYPLAPAARLLVYSIATATGLVMNYLGFLWANRAANLGTFAVSMVVTASIVMGILAQAAVTPLGATLAAFGCLGFSLLITYIDLETRILEAINKIISFLVGMVAGGLLYYALLSLLHLSGALYPLYRFLEQNKQIEWIVILALILGLIYFVVKGGTLWVALPDRIWKNSRTARDSSTLIWSVLIGSFFLLYGTWNLELLMQPANWNLELLLGPDYQKNTKNTQYMIDLDGIAQIVKDNVYEEVKCHYNVYRAYAENKTSDPISCNFPTQDLKDLLTDLTTGSKGSRLVFLIATGLIFQSVMMLARRIGGK